MRRTLTTGALAVLASAALGATAANAAPSGAAFSTNPGGATVNENHYSKKSDVSINGGPTRRSQRHAAALPDGEYQYRITDASGKTTLTTEEGRFRVEGGVIVWSTGAATTSPSGDILTVSVGDFGDSLNGVYKLWIAPAGSDFARKSSKTDNFLMGKGRRGAQPPADEPPADEPPADEPPADEPPADEPPADEPSF